MHNARHGELEHLNNETLKYLDIVDTGRPESEHLYTGDVGRRGDAGRWADAGRLGDAGRPKGVGKHRFFRKTKIAGKTKPCWKS